MESVVSVSLPYANNAPLMATVVHVKQINGGPPDW